VSASAVAAGIIASRSGSPIAIPAPRRTVRRDRYFLVKYMQNVRILLGCRPG
jgi:hypothetical protein